MSAVGSLAAVGGAIAAGLKQAAATNAQAAARANGVSAAAQKAQGDYNKMMADTANNIGTERLAEMYNYNSAQAAAANQFTSDMWNKTAAWNEMMWEKSANFNKAMMERQMEFNSAEAQKNREWQEQMRKTSYQTAIADMQAAGLNPILAVTGGGIATGAGSGGAASVGMASSSPASMSSASGAMASGGTLNGISASESSYQGQMEYMAGMLGLLSAGMNGLSTAMQVMGENGGVGQILGKLIEGIINPPGSKTSDRADYPNTGRRKDLEKIANQHKNPKLFGDYNNTK